MTAPDPEPIKRELAIADIVFGILGLVVLAFLWFGTQRGTVYVPEVSLTGAPAR